jgi:hypothetical protein
MVHTGASPAAGGGFSATFTFTAKKVGTTTIDFTGHFWPNLNLAGYNQIAAAPAPPITVVVKCDYRISLYSVWTLPGERILDVLGVVQSVKVSLDDKGKFSTRATMSSTAAWMGPCPGTSKIAHSQVRIDGEQTASPGTGTRGSLLLHIAYYPVSSTTTEGCAGKSRSDQGTPEALHVLVGSAGTVTAPHVLRTYVQAVGSTTVTVTPVP